MAFSLLCALGGCGLIPAGEEQKAEDSEPPPAEARADVQLNGVVAGLVGKAILFQNHSTEPLENVLIILNEGGVQNDFRYVVRSIGPNTTTYYMARRFKNEFGGEFHEDAVKVQSVSVYADTPRGRGVWQGAYRVSP